MSYEVIEVVGLPVMEEKVVHVMSGTGEEVKDTMATGATIRKEPGDTITDAEFKKAGQSDADIASLIKSGAIKEAS